MHIFPWAIFACSVTHLCKYFIDGKTITRLFFFFFLNNIKYLFQHVAVLLSFQNCNHNASSNFRAGKTRINIEHMYLCENVCVERVYTSLSLSISMYTHIKTKHVTTLELCSYIGLCLLEEELSGNPAAAFLHLKINFALKISSDIQPP